MFPKIIIAVFSIQICTSSDVLAQLDPAALGIEEWQSDSLRVPKRISHFAGIIGPDLEQGEVNFSANIYPYVLSSRLDFGLHRSVTLSAGPVLSFSPFKNDDHARGAIIGAKIDVLSSPRSKISIGHVALLFGGQRGFGAEEKGVEAYGLTYFAARYNTGKIESSLGLGLFRSPEIASPRSVGFVGIDFIGANHNSVIFVHNYISFADEFIYPSLGFVIDFGDSSISVSTLPYVQLTMNLAGGD